MQSQPVQNGALTEKACKVPDLLWNGGMWWNGVCWSAAHVLYTLVTS